METSSFFSQLIRVSFMVTLLQYAIIYFFPKMADYNTLFWLSQLFFVLLSLISFRGAKHFVRLSNKNAFSQFIMMLILGRLFLSIAVIVGYFKLFHPDSKLFLVPFFMVYIFYTVFEVLFLSAIGREV